MFDTKTVRTELTGANIQRYGPRGEALRLRFTGRVEHMDLVSGGNETKRSESTVQQIPVLQPAFDDKINSIDG